ncbi:MAG: hypothetical protein ACOYN8_16435 [Pseudanabaena sp.]
MKFNRATFSIVNLHDEDTEDKAYWLSRSPSDRLSIPTNSDHPSKKQPNSDRLSILVTSKR